MEEIDFRDYFYYDENSQSGIRRLFPVLAGRYKKIVLQEANSIAGWCDKEGYWRVKVNRHIYQVNRVVWELFFGKIMCRSKIIDHVDGNTSNNNIRNLRIGTIKSNNENQKKYSNNSSGVTGVRWMRWDSEKSDVVLTYAVAHWRDSTGKNSQKTYSVLRYGLLPAFKMACEYREKMIKELNSNGASYTERHGK